MSNVFRADLKNITKRKKRLANPRNGVVAAALRLVEHHLDSWDKGKGGTGKTLQLPKINPSYKEQKIDKRGVGIIDMMYSGDMRKSLDVRNIKRNEASLTFAGAENIDKARKNKKRRPQMMGYTHKIRQAMINIFLRFLER